MARDDHGELRGFLVQLAYRMLGSVQDAEDVAHDAWLRWDQAGRPEPDSPRAWFARTCTNLCIDRLRARQREHQRYFGEWLPEPWADAADEQGGASVDETLSLALMHALQRLSPAERAVFLLHDVFDYEFEDVAAMLGLEPANCRQLAVRARRHLDEPPRRRADAAEVQRLGATFFAALRDGDVAGLRDVLREDVVLRTDGGGKVTAVHYPLLGRERVARFFDRIFIRRRFAVGSVQATRFNGGPGFVVRDGDAVVAAYQFTVRDGRIATIDVQRNPDKLRHL